MKEYETYNENTFRDEGNLRLENDELRLLKNRITNLEEKNVILKRLLLSSKIT
jgi:hypothetical protein